VYGVQTIMSGAKVTPFGYQGSYTDSTGLIYLINRYYDPTTDQFLGIDPDVLETDQPYVFTNDNPLNAEDLWVGTRRSRAVRVISRSNCSRDGIDDACERFGYVQCTSRNHRIQPQHHCDGNGEFYCYRTGHI